MAGLTDLFKYDKGQLKHTCGKKCWECGKHVQQGTLCMPCCHGTCSKVVELSCIENANQELADKLRDPNKNNTIIRAVFCEEHTAAGQVLTILRASTP